MLALLERFLRNSSRNSRDRQEFGIFVCFDGEGSMIDNIFRANFLQKLVWVKFIWDV